MKLYVVFLLALLIASAGCVEKGTDENASVSPGNEAEGSESEFSPAGDAKSPAVPGGTECASAGESPDSMSCCAGLEEIPAVSSDPSGVCLPDPSSSSVCAACGDGTCSVVEDECNCPEDCGDETIECASFCGDGICQDSACEGDACPCPEDGDSCPEDCANTTHNDARRIALAYLYDTFYYKAYGGIELRETGYREINATAQEINYTYDSSLGETGESATQVEVMMIVSGGEVVGATTTEKFSVPDEPFCGYSTGGACASDKNCTFSGCSGEVCQPLNEAAAVTTCEYRDCYNAVAYHMICKCVSNRCVWSV